MNNINKYGIGRLIAMIVVMSIIIGFVDVIQNTIFQMRFLNSSITDFAVIGPIAFQSILMAIPTSIIFSTFFVFIRPALPISDTRTGLIWSFLLSFNSCQIIISQITTSVQYGMFMGIGFNPWLTIVSTLIALITPFIYGYGFTYLYKLFSKIN